MRIIAGLFKSRLVHTPVGKNTRPTQDRIKEAIFSMIESQMDLTNTTIADLYAGSGSLGLEALSRGARYAFFVEDNKVAFEIIKKNIENFKLEKQSRIIFKKVLKSFELIGQNKRQCDVIFLDPPYELKELDKVIESIFTQGILAKNGLCVIETGKKRLLKIPIFAQMLKQKYYGDTQVLILKQDPNVTIE